MNETSLKLKVYTDLEELKLIHKHPCLEIHFGDNLEELLDLKNESKMDILATESKNSSMIKTFKGMAILKGSFTNDTVIDYGSDIIMLSEEFFLSGFLKIVELSYDFQKLKIEKSQMTSQLEKVNRQYGHCQNTLYNMETEEINKMAMLSHEIRTPINVILGHANLLKKSDLSEKQAQYIDIIEKCGKMLMESLEDVSFYEESINNLKAPKINEFDIRTRIDRIHDVFRSYSEEKGLSYEVDYDERIAYSLKGDYQKLEMLLKQLLSNALKFTHNGSIKFAAKCLKDEKSYQTIAFEIEDTGIGFDIAQQDHLFKPFYQGEHYLQRHYDGLGLGLPIANSIVKQLKGKMNIKSTLGVGSRFEILFDFDKGESSYKTHTDANILLVEDNALNRRVIKDILEKEGLSIALAENGREALEILENHKFSLILMDLIMPVMDGYEVSRLIRQKGIESPIVIISASVTELDDNIINKLGINDFLIKNHDVNKYLDIIGKYIMIPQKENAKLDEVKLSTILSQQNFEIINANELLLRYNHRYELIIKVIDGINDQLCQLSGYWHLLKMDPYDKGVKQYLHNLKGLVKSLDGTRLSFLIEQIEKSYNLEDYNSQNYSQLKENVKIFHRDIVKLRHALISHAEVNETGSSIITDSHEVTKTLRELIPLLENHDVKKIRKHMETITDLMSGDYFHNLESLVNIYRYEEAIELIVKILEEDGKDICLN